MGLGEYVYPRYAVATTFANQSGATVPTVPIDQLRAHCFWYPSQSLDGREVSGHVLYVAQPLDEAVEVTISGGESESAAVEVEGAEPDIHYRLAQPVPASRFSSVAPLIRAVIEKARLSLPPHKRQVLSGLSEAGAPELALLRMEGILRREGLHVLVPLSVGKRYHLFTDATEALLPVSPLELKRQSRLCFVLLSTDSLVDKYRESPWLRQASELMALPVNALRAHPKVVGFVTDLPALRPAADDPHLMWELASALHEVTGGWPDLCDRFRYERLERLQDVPSLRAYLREFSMLLRRAESTPEQYGEKLLVLALGEGGVADLAPRAEGESDILREVLERPSPFTWEDHGRGYLDGILGWDRGLAVPRSKVLELVLRGRLALSKSPSKPPASSQSTTIPVSLPDRDPTQDKGSEKPSHPEPGPNTVRWLHVSDFHFKGQSDTDTEIVLESLIKTVSEFAKHGRRADLVFVTGDVAFSGEAKEYERAETFLGKLCEAAGVAPDAVHLCPGNHDVYRPAGEGLARTLTDAKAVTRYFEEKSKAYRHHLLKMQAWREFYDRFYKGSSRRVAEGYATALPELVQIRNVKLGILPLNSALFAQDDQDTGKLLLGESVVKAGVHAIEAADIRLAYMHHPVSDLSELERKLVAERLLSGCHFVLRGHLHDTEAQYVNTAYTQSLVLAAGAAYQGRFPYQNRALYVEAEILRDKDQIEVRPYPIRYELTGLDRWTLDTSVFPRSYPTYLQNLSMSLTKKV